MSSTISIDTAVEAASDPRIKGFGVLLDAAKVLERLMGRALEAECGISHAMFEVLLRIAGAEGDGERGRGRAGGSGVTMGEISDDLILTSGGVTRLIDRMIEAGLVERLQDEGDRRVFRVSMTATGEDVLVRAARLHAHNLDEHLFRPLQPGEASAMLNALDRLGQHARHHMPRLG